MSLGAWIFLSALFLGLIALFIATRGQLNWKKIITWPWKKIVIRIAIVITSLIFLVGILLGGQYIYLKIVDRPKVQKSFWGLTLDSTKEDIKFLKGTPKEEHKGRWIYHEFKKTKISNFQIILIQFADDKIQFIDGYGLQMQGVKNGDSYEHVIKKFGTPSHISQSKDDLIRILCFEKYNVFFALEKGEVLFSGIYNPHFGPIRCKEEKEEQNPFPREWGRNPFLREEGRNPYLELKKEKNRKGETNF